MKIETRLITEYPYSPTIVSTLREHYFIKYLSRWFNSEPLPLIKYRLMPEPLKSVYGFLETKVLMLYLRANQMRETHRFRNIFWMTHYPPLLIKGKLAEKIESSGLGEIIYDFADDNLIASKYYGREYLTEKERNYKKGLQKILSRSTSLWMHENRLKDYLDRGFEVSDPMILPNAGDPELFKATPLPKDKVIAHFGVFGNRKSYEARNVSLLIDAFRIVAGEHPDAKLLICGSMAAEVRQIVDRETKGLNAEIIGERVPYFQVHNLFERAYMIVKPLKRIKIWKKLLGSSQLALDAAAAGRPFIMADIRGGVPEDLKTIFCDFTPEDMAEKICRLLDDRKYAENIGKADRRAIERNHSWKIRARKLYEHITSKGL